ncbi:MAG: VanZ family protein, partial [Deltaproteobacteria bacterium]|nr:VanZ family protein [Deltaproteobacteria bacterium]
GKKIAARRTGPLTFTRWNGSYPLVVGSDARGRSSWKGSIRTIAIFNRALQEKEILALSGNLRDLAPLICYAYTDMDGPSIKDSGIPPPADLFVPHRFVPFQRDFLELPGMGHIKFTVRIMDIIINVAGFIPLGLILSLYYSQENESFIRPLIMAVIVGALTSLIIESSQAFLAGRSSSMLDLVNNIIGSSLGVFFHHLRMVPISQQRT